MVLAFKSVNFKQIALQLDYIQSAEGLPPQATGNSPDDCLWTSSALTALLGLHPASLWTGTGISVLLGLCLLVHAVDLDLPVSVILCTNTL